jgi:hypothetical protein
MPGHCKHDSAFFQEAFSDISQRLDWQNNFPLHGQLSHGPICYCMHFVSSGLPFSKLNVGLSGNQTCVVHLNDSPICLSSFRLSLPVPLSLSIYFSLSLSLSLFLSLFLSFSLFFSLSLSLSLLFYLSLSLSYSLSSTTLS